MGLMLAALVWVALPAGAGQPQPLPLAGYLRHGGTQLDLRGAQVADRDLCALTGPEFARVSAVLLGSTAVRDEGLRCLARLPLTHLDLGRTLVGDAGLRHLQHLRLQRLDLTGTPVSDAGLTHLRSMPLRVLVLSDTQVVGPGLQALDGFDLRVLDLSHAPLGDEAVALLRHLKRLETLVLSETGVTEAALGQLGLIPGLKAVDLSGTKVGREAVARFRLTHPGIEVNVERPVR